MVAYENARHMQLQDEFERARKRILVEKVSSDAALRLQDIARKTWCRSLDIGLGCRTEEGSAARCFRPAGPFAGAERLLDDRRACHPLVCAPPVEATDPNKPGVSLMHLPEHSMNLASVLTLSMKRAH